jgi:hypothetical protein
MLRSAKPFFSATPSSGQGCALLFQREDKARDKAANIRLPTSPFLGGREAPVNPSV